MVTLSQSFEKSIQALVGELAPRSRAVIKKRYGLGEKESWTLEAIGKKEGITRERVRQIESDALGKLKKSPVFASLKNQEEAIVGIVEKYGGIVGEQSFGTLPEFDFIKDKRVLFFFLELCSSLVRKKEGDNFVARWQLKDAQSRPVEEALNQLARELTDLRGTLKREELVARFCAHLKKAGITQAKPAAVENYLALSKHIQKNAWGEYGHVSSPFVRPKGMRDGAYVALSRAQKPLHFKDIAKHIETFVNRRVHVQTVHNELIKDARFVLVGRGLYGLADWGYQPGFIKDVLARVLKESGPMTREQILQEISKHRQVKPATVLINLQNKKMFRAGEDGTFTLIS